MNLYVISEEMTLKFFSPIWSHVNENEKIRRTIKMQNFEKKNGLEIW